jgi:hypothetical protein
MKTSTRFAAIDGSRQLALELPGGLRGTSDLGDTEDRRPAARPDDGAAPTHLVAHGPRLASLISATVALGAASFGGPLSRDEQALVDQARPRTMDVAAVEDAIRAGHDPLGEHILALRSAADRRPIGCFYTPAPVVESMVSWGLELAPARVIDAGCGSGRFAAAVVRSSPSTAVVAIDRDPLATLACRAALAVLVARDARVIQGDYVSAPLEHCSSRTLFVGNPPYVRHHDLTPEQKLQAKALGRRLGLELSGLAGLHVHFLLATLEKARRGDAGAFITNAEWLDVRYGVALRQALLARAETLAVHLLDPGTAAFPDAMTTAAITCFAVGDPGAAASLRAAPSVLSLNGLAASGEAIERSSLARASRWSSFFHRRESPRTEGMVRLGTLVRVSRGAVTGANGFFLMRREEARAMGVEEYTVPVLSSAREVLEAEGVVHEVAARLLLLDPPRSMDPSAPEHASLRRYLANGERSGVPGGYICRHRRPWWHVGARRPPAVATYMARQPPAFALNPDGMAIVNVLHGFFPRVNLDEEQLRGLVGYLNANRCEMSGLGRTYHGGLEKFEPREMEDILVPEPDRLRD